MIDRLLIFFLLLPLISFSQSKKKQIESLIISKDSLQVLLNYQLEKNNQNTSSFLRQVDSIKNSKDSLQDLLNYQREKNNENTSFFLRQVDSLKNLHYKYENEISEKNKAFEALVEQLNQSKIELEINQNRLFTEKNRIEKFKDTIINLNSQLSEYEQLSSTNRIDFNNFDNSEIILLTGQAIGIDSWLEVYSPTYESYSKSFKEIHVIPDLDNELNVEMANVIPYFSFRDESFNDFSGIMKVFYDRSRNRLATSVLIKNSQIYGNVKLYDVNGQLKCERNYLEGNCIEILRDQAEWNWSFDFKNSNLIIAANSKYYESQKGNNVIYLRSNIKNPEQFPQMIQKEVFNRFFLVNGNKYTGQITSYYTSTGLEKYDYFTLNFKNGLLDGIISISNPEIGKILEERYENGVLKEIIFELEEGSGMAKPVIYLYPPKKEKISVKLELKGNITHSYPVYNEKLGW